MRQGDASDGAYIVVSGDAIVYQEHTEGKKILGEVGRGFMVGEGSFLDEGVAERTATVQAKHDGIVLWELDRAALRNVLDKYPHQSGAFVDLFRQRGKANEWTNRAFQAQPEGETGKKPRERIKVRLRKKDIKKRAPPKLVQKNVAIRALKHLHKMMYRDDPNEQQCNNFACPKDIKCVADLDVVMVLDGSGSLWYRWGPRDRNFKLMQKFTEDLIENSKMATVEASSGQVTNGLRYGVILYSWSPQTISQITHDKAALGTKVKAMKWPRGATYTGRALTHANVLFNMGGTKQRAQVIILVTDGRATNRWRAMRSAIKVKKNGIRIILVPVKNALRQKAEMCRWASKPCSENMIMTPSWRMLISKMRWYLTTMCPVVEAK